MPNPAPVRAQQLAAKTHCIRNHEFTPENTGYRKNGNRICKTCRRDAQRERRTTAQYHEWRRARYHENIEKNREYSRKWHKEKYDSMSVAERHELRATRYARDRERIKEIVAVKKDPLQYLKLDIDQAKLSDEVNFQVDRVDEVDRTRPKCEGNPGPYMDYPEDRPPSVVTAMKLCHGCPILEQCRAYGESLNEGDQQADGVWGGIVWKDGKKLYD